MPQHKFSAIETQMTSLHTELEATFKQLSNALEQLIHCTIEINEVAGNVNYALATDDGEHKIIDKAYDDYAGILEDLKDKINRVDTELNDHLKMCSDLRSDLVELTKETRKPIP
jgi:DNA repair exonuclease SbcCD ATPase subunit